MIIGAAAAAAIGRVAAPTTQIYTVNSANLNGSSQSFYNAVYTASTTSGYTWGMRVKFNSISATHALTYRLSGSSDRSYAVYITATGQVGLLAYYNATQFESILTSASTVTTGQWYDITIRVAPSGDPTYSLGRMEILVDNVSQASANFNHSIYAGSHQDWIGRDATGGQRLAASVSFSYLTGQYTIDSELTDIYNTGDALCYGLLPSNTVTNIEYFARLGNFNGNSGQELTDQGPNARSFTNENSTPFTGTGLSVECT